MRLLVTKDLAPQKLAAQTTVDQLAEVCRGKFITLGPGQSMIYLQKEKEAELVSADPLTNVNLVPHLVQEAAANNVTLLDMATAVLIKANEWRNVSPYIETKRLVTKQMIQAATTPAEIEELVEEVRAFYDQAL